MKLGETILREDALQQASLQSLITTGTLLPILLERQGLLHVVPADDRLQAGDRLIYLLHDPKPKLLKLLSGSSQMRLTLETLPEVENSPISADVAASLANARTERSGDAPVEQSTALLEEVKLE